MSLLSRLAVSAARAYGALSSNPNAVSASYLVVAGGGAGAYHSSASGGGGGAGGLLSGTATLSILNTYTVTVGAGGTTSADLSAGGNGNNSVLSGTGLTTITSTGGGGGGPQNTKGNAGGSGGGATFNGGTAGGNSAGNTPATTPSQGNNGGTTASSGAAGGGGAGAVGSNNSGANGGAGGAGTASSISGSSVTYAGGGGGGSNGATGGTGGTGGGGAGSNSSGAGVAGTANRGGGGGGGGYLAISPYAGAGGSGIVIISYTSATPKFVGGTLTTSGGNQIHTFTSSGTLSPLTPVTASYLVVAGGGGAGGNYGGGGGAGGLLTSSTTLYSGATYVVTVGGGGAVGGSRLRGANGSNSVLSGTGITTVTSTGGGAGGGGDSVSEKDGNSGGSGGGGGGGSAAAGSSTGSAGAGNTPSTSPSQGSNGGTGSTDGVTFRGGGGGGGASATGSNNSSGVGGAGGAGTASSISGSSVTYAGGGGGGGTTSNGAGGAGGGGSSGTNGTANTGGGGGGTTSGTAGAGGSGTVIISYAGSQVFNGGLVTSSGGNTIHTFNATGALTPVTNNLNNSLRFRASNSAYLNRTPTVAGNRKTWTWSAWVKRGTLGTTQRLFCAGASDSVSPYETLVGFNTNDQLLITINGNGATGGSATTSGVFRDPSAWYHIVAYVDMSASGQANKARIYVNGNQQTVTYITLTTTDNTEVNNNVIHRIAANSYALSSYFDGYLTDINFIDGQALEPYYFGNNDAYGNWKPILYKGMYGTNGFYLTFADTSALTTSSNAGLGKDTSGNGNYWATNNISITAGTTYDAMLDVPTNTSATVANYAVMNPLSSASGTLTNGNLTFSNAGAVKGAKGTFALESGKWYWENTITTLGVNDLGVGILFDGATDAMRDGTVTSTFSVFYQANTNVRKNGSVVANYASYTTGDIIGIAYDADIRSITFYKNNVSQGSITADVPTSPYVVWIIQPNSITATVNPNFGQRPFTYTPPTGFVALNTYNLPTPTILQGNKYMDATLYTGTGSAGTDVQTVVNAAQFKPDLVWTKSRSNAVSHHIGDSVRGIDKTLFSNTTGAEATYTYDIHAFNSNGFTVGNDGSQNTSGYTYVGWQWQAGQSSGSSNTSGTITSTVSVSTTAGFSVATFSGASSGTVGHGLGVAPQMIILKTRTTVLGWYVYHVSIGASGWLQLDTTAAAITGNTAVFGGTTPTSTVFTYGGGLAGTGNYVAYCWAEIAGFSKFGSYTGNGSTDGSFVYTGFRPKFIMIKRTDAVESWEIFDTSRSSYNTAVELLEANSSGAESTSAGNAIDILSNGFKQRNTRAATNASGGTYIFMAYAENPFKNSNAR